MCNAINDTSVINSIFTAAGYTYGPILGLFAFGMMTKRQIKDKFVLIICIAAPILTYAIEQLANGWFGFFVLALNGLLTFLGLWLISSKSQE